MTHHWHSGPNCCGDKDDPYCCNNIGVKPQDHIDDEDTGFFQFDKPTKPVPRPTTLSIETGGESNFCVQWNRSMGVFEMSSTCVQCGITFSRTLRGFVSKDLIIQAQSLGFELGSHLARHYTFSQWLEQQQRKEKQDADAASKTANG